MYRMYINLKFIGLAVFCSLLFLTSKNACSQTAIADSVVRTISINYNDPKGKLNTMFKECIGAGRANEGLRADWQQQLADVKKICDFKYIRMHGLLSDDMAVYKEDKDGNPEYNYMYIDALYDYLLSIGIRPFVELGFMPSSLASGSKTIFWWRGNVTPPKDYGKWAAFIKDLTQHFTARYGENEVEKWYFEVWNEPNLDGFWAGSQDEYFKLYTYTVKAIKSVNKKYKVGGPASAGAAWIPEMIDFCKKNNVPIDFASTHTYGVQQGFLDEFGNSGTVLSKDSMAVSGDIIISRQQIKAGAFPDMELHFTEWSSSYTPADPLHDSYHEASYILEKIKQAGTAANSMSYWVFTDIFEEPGPRFTPFHGGFGLLTIQGIKKPAFFAYQYLNQLYELELKNSDDRSVATKNSNGDFSMLLWDFTNTHPGNKVNNQSYYIQDLPAKSKGKVSLTVTGLKKGKYTVKVNQVGYRVNDSYTSYINMGRPARLSKTEVEKLKNENNGAAIQSATVNIGENGKFNKDLNIRENDVYLIEVVKVATK